MYDRPNDERDAGAAEADRRRNGRLYKSSVTTNIFPPNIQANAQAIGTLTVTSDQPEHFTPLLHEAWIVALAREVSLRLATCCANSGQQDVAAYLRAKSGTPIVIRAEK